MVNDRRSLARGEWFVPLAILVIGIALRIPVIACPTELNVDESLLAAASMRYAMDVVPWRAVDTTTSGPINCVPFVIARWCLPGSDYRGIHLMAAAFQAAIVVITWATLRATASATSAMMAAGAALLFVACAQQAGCAHFTSELMPAVLLAAAGFCVARGLGAATCGGSFWWMAASVLAGIAPWAKLQALPIGGVCWAFCLLAAWRRSPVGRSLQWTTAVTASFLLPSMVFIGLVWFGDAWQDFWQSYVVRNLSYAGEPADMDAPGRVAALFLAARPIRGLLLGTAVFGAAWCWCGCRGWRSATATQRGMACFAAWSLAAAVFAVAKPPWRFTHYEWLLVHPTALVAGLALDLWRHGDRREDDRGRAAGMCTPAVCFAAIMAGLHLTSLAGSVRDARDVMRLRSDGFAHDVAERVASLAGDGRTLGVWGWAARLHVDTGLAPATRHMIGHYLIDDSPQRDFFRAAYLADLEAARPSVFVDAMAPGFFLWRWKNPCRVDDVAGLKRFIDKHYRLVEELSSKPGAPPVRVYVRVREGGRHE